MQSRARCRDDPGTEAEPHAVGAGIRPERVPDGAHDVPLSRVVGLRERLRHRAHLARQARGVRDVDPAPALDTIGVASWWDRLFPYVLFTVVPVTFKNNTKN